MRRFVPAVFLSVLTALPATAAEFTPVTELPEFLEVIEGRELRIGLFGISLNVLPDGRIVVLTSADGVLARLAASELPGRDTRVLRGGTRAWQAAGLPMESGTTALADVTIDVWYRPYDRQSGIEQAMKGYLDWEVDLVAQVERDGDTRFRL